MSVEWERREPADGDPFWEARLGSFILIVRVGCEWVWEWSVDADDEDDIARGTVWVGSDDDEDLDGWDYQHVERAQARCEVVARALAWALPDGWRWRVDAWRRWMAVHESGAPFVSVNDKGADLYDLVRCRNDEGPPPDSLPIGTILSNGGQFSKPSGGA